MTTIAQPFPESDGGRQQIFDRLFGGVNDIGQHFYSGVGVPTFTPPGSARALYIRKDGGTGSTLYVYEGAGWVAK